MSRPLYEGSASVLEHRPSDGHAGLWFDKFCNRWQVRGGSWSMSSQASMDREGPKLGWINTVTGRIGDSDEIAEHAARLARLVKRRNGLMRVFTAASRFVTGLGRSHPVENGFAWHPTLGTPYLPGSSVKGLVRAWATVEANPKPPDQVLRRLLGDRDHAGRVVFLDAVPRESVRLEADVMTPHYAGWTPEDPPGDWRSPTPIPFLTTASGTAFLFGLIPGESVTARERRTVADWLCDALAWAGAGAKTSVGYGRFDRDEATEAVVERDRAEYAERVRAEREERAAKKAHAKRLASMTPVERDIEEVLATRQDEGMPEVTAILKEVQRGRWHGDAKIEVARWLQARMKKEKKWRERSKKKNPSKDRDHKRTLAVTRWLDGE